MVTFLKDQSRPSIEKLKNARDSFRKARETHLIHKVKTIEPLGINKRDEL